MAPPATAWLRLAAADMDMQPDVTLRTIAERHTTRPLEVTETLLAPGYLPPKYQ